MYYNSTNNFDYNDCVARGACSVSPSIASMQEVMYILLRQIAYYQIKLNALGIKNEKIKFDIISQIAFIDAAKDLSESQVLNSFSKQYINLVKSRKEYLKLCKEKNIGCKDVKNLLKLSPNTNLSSILKRGDREFLQKYKTLNFNDKYKLEILFAVIKSVCVNFLTLYELGKDCDEVSDLVLSALNFFNKHKINQDEAKEYIETLAQCDIKLLALINKAQIEKYGKPEKTSVSYSTSPNKAILVSGSNLEDLKSVLEYVKDKDIDVYTNGNLLIAHVFPFFKHFKNLKGHFGTGIISTILDFATFPGAILLTKNESQNVEYLYRGRLFTTDETAPKGVVKIIDNNFEPLFQSAMQAKGFAKGRQKKPETAGYNDDELNSAIQEIVEKDYKKIFVIGQSNFSIKQNDYFKKFYAEMPLDTFAISFSNAPEQENVLSINLGNDYALFYGVLQKIFEKIPPNSDKLAFFLTKCDINSLSNIINLKINGAKNIFLSDCPPFIVNPSVLKAFAKLFNIYSITSPKDDLERLK